MSTAVPKVSVAITFYNQEKYASQTLESVLAQEVNFPFEIVIGEDNSTDDTRALIKQYQEKYPELIRVFYNLKNCGVVLNIKNVLDNCRGKYIAILGGDDLFSCKDKLQRQYDFLESHPDYGFVHSDARLIIDHNTSTPQIAESAEAYFNLSIKSGQVYEDLLKKCYVVASTAFFRKDLYDQYGQLAQWHAMGFLMEDFPLWLAFSRVAKFAYINEALSTYRILSNTVSRPRDPLKDLKFWLSSAQVSFYFIKQYGASDEVRARVYNKNYAFYLEYAIHFSDTAKAAEALAYFQSKGQARLEHYFYYWAAKSTVVLFMLKSLRKIFKWPSNSVLVI